jgi:acetolactate synthase-1/2/3 large subunit
VPEPAIDEAAAILRGDEPALILLGGDALHRAALEAASRIAAATGAALLAETFPARMERGAGLPRVARLAYLPEMAASQLAGIRHLILAGTRAPVSFFAYPGQASSLVPDGARVHLLAEPGDDAPGALDALAGQVAPDTKAAAEPPTRPTVPDGPLEAGAAAAVIGALLPEGAIVSDESNTSGLGLGGATAGAPPHDWLTVTGGAIGHGLPMAVGAAVACPDRPVIALESDGSAMYTISGLWTCAHEGLDVTIVLFSNRSYAILGMELDRAASGAGATARGLLQLSPPVLDFTAIAGGMGVPSRRATTAAEFADALRWSLAEPGPHLVEAVLP